MLLLILITFFLHEFFYQHPCFLLARFPSLGALIGRALDLFTLYIGSRYRDFSEKSKKMIHFVQFVYK